ncbi:DUF3176 domain-containing protein [Aspergillus mulundensis]|uniref:Uncharacterized protein n=1 Tax=Aspergillus mulundensis TaxID=1810919 RepID=A0A3D8QN06_9EURO|nr:hypothetical protein DSM5745_10179 [Aspergillus mulundensis]RDW63068.1 hypothetical protein DSM5745_10179 [Aspergillus mulundensis]
MDTELSLLSGQPSENQSDNYAESLAPSTPPAVTTQSPPPRKESNSWKSRVQNGWLLEAISTSFSNLCFIALCSVLLAYDDEQRPALVSLNFVVSVLGTACKSSLILAIAEALSQWKWLSLSRKPTRLLRLHELDNASRGPLGSAILLFSRNNHMLVHVGAAVLILLLGFDPFIQQILTYPMRLTERIGGNDRALVGQARYGGPNTINSTYTPSWETAYHRAMWADDFEIRPSCPSGNCTWSTFQTVGYCSRCTDRTAEASLVFNEQPVQATVSGTETWTRCQVALPGVQEEAIIWSTPFSTLWSPTPDGDTFLVFDLENPMFGLAHAQLRTNETLMQSGAEPSKALFVQNVTECRLSLCLWEYSVSVANSALSVTAAAVDHGQTFYADDNHQTVCWVPEGAGSTETPARTVIPTEPSLLLNTTGLRTCGLYHLRTDDFAAMREVVLTRPTNATNGTRWEIHSWYGDDNPNFERIQALGLETLMTRLARSLTETLIDDSNYTIPDKVWDPEPFVKVRWPWLIPPAILVLTGNVFFALTVYTSKKEKVLPWKSSSLALFYHGLESVDHDDYLYTTASRMEEKAGVVDIRLGLSDQDGR